MRSLLRGGVGWLVAAGVSVVALWAVLGTGSRAAEPGGPEIELKPFAQGLSQPVHLTGDGSGRLFVVERQGRIRLLSTGGSVLATYLDITDRVLSAGAEQGLLSVAFPPDFAASGHFYVDYTAGSGAGETRISRFTADPANPSRALPGSEQVILAIGQPYANHNGGQVAFGPDGMLYIGTGDGGGEGDPQGNAQDPYELLGKLLRVDPRQLPVDIDTHYAKGLRNPWRFSFDRATGDIYIGDVGQDSFEEVDYLPAGASPGANFGWDVMEGNHCYPPPGTSCQQPPAYVAPIAEYPRTLGSCAVTGGFVYRGSQVPDLSGTYVYGDFCSGRIWGLRQAGGAWTNAELLQSGLSIISFGEGDDGELYVVDYGGAIYKIQRKSSAKPSATPTKAPSPTATPTATPPGGPKRGVVPAVARD
ncbi:MAG: PQQ-dependent sugar dehydrogenase [Chloroflexi bacterium]|nr:PQQ-dependent sugar dehydrogenase [Chloroflexota bacterium]